VTTKGDTLVASAADTLIRLGIGAANTIYYVNTDTPGWGTAEALNLSRLIITSEASNATPTPARSSFRSMHCITAQAEAAAFAAPSGTPANGDSLLIRVEDDGSNRALTWNAIYEAAGVTMPTTTTAGKKLYIGFIYNSTDSKWDCIASVEEA
jgi:hypothetical protein